MPKPDHSKQNEEHYKEMKIEEFTNEFNELYSQFKVFNLLAVYTTTIAEINMGFTSRICNLSLDTVEFVKTNKGEIAELVFRTTLETFIVGSWLLKKRDISLYQRFREYSTGREKFFVEHIIKNTTDEAIKKNANDIIDSTIKEAGVLEIDVATEKGDIFNVTIAQMAEELWGKDFNYYFFYKRSSEVTHGHWKVIAKYHLAKSRNPMHNGLYSYNDNPNRFAGLIPAFLSLRLASEFLLIILNDIESGQTNELKGKLNNFHERLMQEWTIYFNKYITKTAKTEQG
jgi:hypothetical protein